MEGHEEISGLLHDLKHEIEDIGMDTDRILKEENEMEGMEGMLMGMLGQKGIDPAALMAMMGNKDGGFMGSGGSGFIVLILFLLLLGGRGFGGLGGDGAGAVVNETNTNLLMQAINTQGIRQEQAISSLATNLNCDCNAIKSALCGIDKNIAVLEGQLGFVSADIKNAVQSCCCNIRTEMQMGFCNVSKELAGMNSFIQSQFCSQNAYLADQFCQIRGREDAREIQILRDRLQAQNEAANTALILQAIANKDSIAYKGTIVGNTVSGNGTLS
ncbi:MAG: hypothetical protein RSD95_03820 [Clostridia bacterium]